MNSSYNYNLRQDTEDAICNLVDVADRDPDRVYKAVIDLLAANGLNEQSAPSCKRSPDLAGAVAGLGYALTDLSLQSRLQVFATSILAIAGPDLRLLFEVEFLEPFLRDASSVEDEGFRRYMKWFLSLRNDPTVSWAVEEAYESYGAARLQNDIRIFCDKL